MRNARKPSTGEALGVLLRRHWPTLLTAGVVAGQYASDTLRHRREQGVGYTLRGAELDVSTVAFLHAAEAITSAPISVGNDLELLINGDRIFPAFLDTIASAERSLNLLTFVYWRGDIAGEIAEALIERARAGVAVNVLLDAFGTAKMKLSLVSQMRDAGITVARFRPPKPYAVRRLNNRTHRKVVVADGRVGLIGGVGIAEEWTGDAQDPDHWRDTHLRVRGPIVRGIQGAFAENWLEATGEVLVGEDYLPALPDEDGAGPMQLVRSSAGVGDTNMEALFYLAISCARETLDLTSAYFAPRGAFVDVLVAAAERGVQVRILVPGPYIDKQLVRLAGRSVYDRLLDAGVRIWEYQPTMLHAKSLTVDGAWATVGSANFDNRSFQLNDEATLCVQSRSFAGELTEQFERDLERSEEIRPDRWKERAKLGRVQEKLTVLARREL